ncbi:universal stress protein [Rivibacter subsaxonicus]|uniref:Nucleotide-binding universal stress UspA family protein n=1 Tax=Rivibacter subsaxonicus TaxID=457575 RepID=A0A4Q7VVQ0_9BURK|nr:universal stress protein [Rivibacter subsaxonicus]RZU00754.1 nucleotide-binding universal stress UspA family protein [Rivibacter subsaxonicus]
MKILLAVDGSAFTKRMLAYFAANAEWLGAGHEITVLTVVPAVPARAAAVIERAQLLEYYADEAEKVLKPVRRFLAREDLKLDFVHKVGPAAETLAKTAAAGRFGLVVMGSQGHSALGNLVLGSVATGVLAKCSVPVLLVR